MSTYSSNPSVAAFDVDLTESSDVIMEVLDESGTRLWCTQLSDAAPGHHQIFFDGRDRQGRPIRGTYYYQVTANGTTITRKVTFHGGALRFAHLLRLATSTLRP